MALRWAKIAEKTWPWICAIITSGSPVHAHKRLPKTAKFIMKPWAADALLALFLQIPHGACPEA
jgi:hypothetical protein